jgi:hypothetical protein
MIKKENNLYFVYNEEGTKKLSKGYSTEEEAKKRLQQIEYFKYANLDEIYEDEESEDAEYQGKEVTLNKPFRTPEESKKFAVYVKNDEGNVVIVRFGDPDMEIKRDDPESRKAFRARHNCEEKTDKTKAGYWSCKFWSSKSVNELLDNSKIVSIADRAVSFESNIDDKTGFLNVDAVIARTGIQKYLPIELGDEGDEPIGVYRPKDQVAHEESVASFTNIPVTDEHPHEMVNIDNIKNYYRGSISKVEVIDLDNGETGLKTRLVITDKELIDKIKSGKKELSVGYENILVKQSGTYNGESYDYIQTNIIANHLAVVDAGRCGGVCKMMIDNNSTLEKEKKDMVKITINGVEFEVAEEVAAEMQKLQEAKEALQAKVEEGTGDGEGEEKEAMDKLQATVDSLKSQNDKLVKSVDAQVTEKVELLALAKDSKVEVKVCDSNLDIKRAIVTSYGLDAKDKSEAYLNAAIDMKKQEANDAEQREQKALDSINKVGGEYKSQKAVDYDAIAEQEIN